MSAERDVKAWLKERHAATVAGTRAVGRAVERLRELESERGEVTGQLRTALSDLEALDAGVEMVAGWVGIGTDELVALTAATTTAAASRPARAGRRRARTPDDESGSGTVSDAALPPPPHASQSPGWNGDRLSASMPVEAVVS
jgi:hypothetical protein